MSTHIGLGSLVSCRLSGTSCVDGSVSVSVQQRKKLSKKANREGVVQALILQGLRVDILLKDSRAC